MVSVGPSSITEALSIGGSGWVNSIVGIFKSLAIGIGVIILGALVMYVSL